MLAKLEREGKPVRRRLRVGVDGSGLLEIEMDDLDEPEARWWGGSCGQLLLLLLLLSGLLGFATSVHLPISPHISLHLPTSPATRLRHLGARSKARVRVAVRVRVRARARGRARGRARVGVAVAVGS